MTHPASSPSDASLAVARDLAPLADEPPTTGPTAPLAGDDPTAAAVPGHPVDEGGPADARGPGEPTREPSAVAGGGQAGAEGGTPGPAATDDATDRTAPEAAPAAEAKPAAGQAGDLSPAASAARLAALFPALFGTGSPRPLKLRIQPEIQQRAPGVFSRKALSIFLHRHTTSTAYLKALVGSAHRFDLDGQPAGEVLEEHREAARAELERRRALHDSRRAAEREAQRGAQEAARRASAADADARRRRAELLRAFEGSTLTPANFCALKGIAPDELEALLAQARSERTAAPPPPRRAPEGADAGRPRRHGADAREPAPRRGRPRG